MLVFILAAVVIFLAHLVVGVTGFGTAVLGLPLLAMLLGLDVGKQLLLVLSNLLYIYIIIRWRRHIDWRQLVIIALLASIGMPLGIWLYDVLPARAALMALGVFVAVVALRNLLGILPERRAPRWLAKLLLIAGGVVHGALTAGGPLLVVYADQSLRHKTTFRATLCFVWLALSSILIFDWTWQHQWLWPSFKYALLGFPFMLAGLAVGEALHFRVSEKMFRRCVNVILLVIALLLIFLPGH